MFNNMLDRSQLEAFATIGETLSFERAADRLNVTRSAISQRIKALEQAVGGSLIVRGKPLALTSIGNILFKYVAALRLLEAETLDQIRPHDATSRAVPLAIAVDAHSLDTWFSGVAKKLILRTAIELEVIVDDADPAFPKLVRGDVVGSISTVPLPADGCVATAIGAMEYRCVASREFFGQHFSNGFTLHSAKAAPAILLGRRMGLLDRYLASVFGISGVRCRKHFLSSPVSQLDAIVAGAGYGPLPEQLVRSQLAEGTLIDVTPDNSFSLPLYWHHWRVAPLICGSISSEIEAAARAALNTAPCVGEPGQRIEHDSDRMFRAELQVREAMDYDYEV